MKRTMMQTIKLIHARYGVYLLQDLIRRNIGTNTVENRCKDLCTNLNREKESDIGKESDDMEIN